jgi:7,8-dihydroneopterin aldolase/epimerase/oxygenase
MYTITLNNLTFFAYHGVHPEENIVGGNFEVSIEVDFFSKKEIAALEDTLNYVSIYDIVKKRFAITEKLLEVLAQDIPTLIYEMDNRIKRINISIQKLNAPIANFEGSVGIRFTKEFS